MFTYEHDFNAITKVLSYSRIAVA